MSISQPRDAGQAEAVPCHCMCDSYQNDPLGLTRLSGASLRVEAVSQPRHEGLAEAAPCHRLGGRRRDDPFGLHAFGCISAPRSCESALVNGQLLISVVAW